LQGPDVQNHHKTLIALKEWGRWGKCVTQLHSGEKTRFYASSRVRHSVAMAELSSLGEQESKTKAEG